MSYIFVGGSQRSGTSVLAAALCAGAETNPYLGESGCFRALVQNYRLMDSRFDDEMIFHFGTRPVMDDYFAATLRLFLSHTLASQAPATSLVLKEPHMTMLFPDIWKLIPESKFVIVVRDPRDIVASMLRVGEKLAAEGQQHLFNSGKIAQIAASVAQFYKPVLATARENAAFKEACHWVKYEDFVRDPAPVMQQIRQFTGLNIEQFDPADPTKRTHPKKVESRKISKRAQPWNTELMREKGLSTKHAGSFEERLTAEQIATIEETIGGLIKRFGYPLTAAQAPA